LRSQGRFAPWGLPHDKPRWKTAVEFSWDGGDGADGTPLAGRGWAILDGDELNGMFFIHMGDDSEFVAMKTKKPSKKRGRR
jgi:hypothetical protein